MQQTHHETLKLPSMEARKMNKGRENKGERKWSGLEVETTICKGVWVISEWAPNRN